MALAGLWLLDAVLECQPSFFQPEFFGGMLMMNMTAPPAWLWNLLTAVEPVVVTHAAPANAAAVAVQFAIGLGLLWRTTVRAALALSVPWALTVWLFGEMGGGLFVGGGSALTGAPGAALLYAIVAVLLWPRRPDAGTVVADGGLLPRPAPLLVWAAVWVGTAALEGGYLDRSPTFAAQAMDNAAVAGPGWLHAAGQAVGGLVGTHGALFAAVAGTVQAAVGVGVLFPGARRAALAAGAALALFYGAVGQAFGGLFSNGVLGILGSGATDPGAAPITVVLALTLWPRVPRPAPRRDSSPPGSWAHRFRARAAPTPSPSGG
ncbi:MAG TPA: hypothetical protein VFP61_08840 [Acidimicrobiales bacterium]|nr:hypothetical protein [Acidimicrobiales bacterium]